MEYDPSVATACDDRRRRKGNRKRNVIYFNPPYSKTIKTNIGRVFLNIIREEFSKGHPLYPVINKNNIKMSYRCMPNMSQQINRHNKKLLSKDTVKKNVANVTLASDDNNGLESFSNNNNTVAVIVTLANDDHVTMIRDHREVSSEEATQSSNNNTAASPDVTSVSDDQATPANNNKTCNCSKANRSTCPLKGNCLVCCLVYRATVTRMDNCNCETYTGVTAGTFKCRWYGHCHDMTHRPDEEHQGTTLSNHVWKLKDQSVQYKIDWAVVTKSADFNPATGICRVCLEEKFFIMFCPEGATLNQRSEFFTHCRHFHKFLLAPPPPKKTTQKKRKAPNR